MRRSISLLFLCMALCCAAVAGTPLPDGPHIVVSGSGKVSATPDSAAVTFRFEHRAARPLPAKQAVDAEVNRLLQGLPAFSVDDEDVTASDLQAAEDIDYDDDGNRTSRGFIATRTVIVNWRASTG